MSGKSSGGCWAECVEHAERRTRTTWRKADFSKDLTAYIIGDLPTANQSAGPQVTRCPARCCVHPEQDEVIVSLIYDSVVRFKVLAAAMDTASWVRAPAALGGAH